MYRGVDTVGYYRVDHVLDPRRKGEGQYFWRKAVVRAFFFFFFPYADTTSPLPGKYEM